MVLAGGARRRQDLQPHHGCPPGPFSPLCKLGVGQSRTLDVTYEHSTLKGFRLSLKPEDWSVQQVLATWELAATDFDIVDTRSILY